MSHLVLCQRGIFIFIKIMHMIFAKISKKPLLSTFIKRLIHKENQYNKDKKIQSITQTKEQDMKQEKRSLFHFLL